RLRLRVHQARALPRPVARYPLRAQLLRAMAESSRAPARGAEISGPGTARRAQGAATAPFLLQCAQYDLGADARRYLASRPITGAAWRAAAREPAIGRSGHDPAGRGAATARALRASHAGPVRGQRRGRLERGGGIGRLSRSDVSLATVAGERLQAWSGEKHRTRAHRDRSGTRRGQIESDRA